MKIRIFRFLGLKNVNESMGKKENRKTKSKVNDQILNIITPTFLRFEENGVMLGENYGKIFAIVRYPSEPIYGWLSKIVALEGTTAKVQFEPTDSGELVQRCNEQIRDYKSDLAVIKEESIKQQKERAIQDISDMIRRINENQEVVGYVNILLFVQAPDKQVLKEREKKVKAIIATFGGQIRNLTNLQEQGYQAISPFGISSKEISDFGLRNMPLSTFIGGFINSKSGINDGIGIQLGKTDNGQLVIVDTRKRGNDRTNMNWFITGLPGVGKSTVVKYLTQCEFALGAKLIFNDPEREYVELTKALGGKVINCAGGTEGHINILQARTVPKLEDEEEDDLYHDEGHGTSELALHFQTIRTFLRLYKKNITDLQLAKLEEILERTYQRFDITWDTDVSKIKEEEWPILKDLYDDISCELEKNPNDKDLKDLQILLRSAAVGADSQIFNGHTNIRFDTDMIDLDISSLIDGDESILRAQTHNINSFVWNYISKDRNEIVLYIVDEGYLLVDPNNPEAIVFIKNISKRIRKYGGGLVFITHSCVDVLDPSVKRHGQAIIDNACFKLIMGTDGKNLEETTNLFDLTEAEKNLLLSRQRGKGLLFVGSSRINARIEVPRKMLELMGTAGGK